MVSHFYMNVRLSPLMHCQHALETVRNSPIYTTAHNQQSLSIMTSLAKWPAKTMASGHINDNFGRGGFERPPVTWYRHPGLRKLYIMMPILFLGATTNGYDGSLLNGLQTMNSWQTCPSRLFNSMHDKWVR